MDHVEGVMDPAAFFLVDYNKYHVGSLYELGKTTWKHYVDQTIGPW